jgi:hypothetical protein
VRRYSVRAMMMRRMPEYPPPPREEVARCPTCGAFGSRSCWRVAYGPERGMALARKHPSRLIKQRRLNEEYQMAVARGLGAFPQPHNDLRAAARAMLRFDIVEFVQLQRWFREYGDILAKREATP